MDDELKVILANTDTLSYEEVEGNPIEITDGIKAKLNKTELKGNTTQDSYSGKNLLNNTSSSAVKNGVTFTKYSDGTVLVNGTATNGTFFNVINDNELPISSTGLIMSGCPSGGAYGTYKLRTTYTDDSFNQDYGEGRELTEGKTIKVITIVISSGTVCNNLLFKPMISTTGGDYEPYVGGTASPNPDYPQAINNVTGEQVVEIAGKNLYNPSYRMYNDTLFVNNCTGTESDGTFTLTATGSDMFIWGVTNAGNRYDESKGQLYEFKEESYTVSVNNPLFTKNYVTYYDENGISLGYTRKASTTFTINKSDKAGAKYFSLRFGYGQAVSGTSYSFTIQLEKGTVTTPVYEPYIGHTYPINLGKNLFDKDNTNILNAWFNSTTTPTITSGDFARTIYVKCKPNTTYTISKTTSARFYVGYTNVLPVAGVEVYGAIGANNRTTPCTLTTGQQAQYLVAFIYHSSYDTLTPEQIMATIQIEENPYATSYSAYKTPIELCKIGDYQDSIKKSTGKNLFDKDNANILNGYFDAGVIKESSTNSRCIYIPCKPSMTYTMSKMLSARFQLAYSNSTPQINGNVLGTIVDNSATSITITTGQQAQYLVAFIYTNSDTSTLTLQQMLDSIQIEDGDTATDLEPYGKVWYKECKIGKVVLDGTETWALTNTQPNNTIYKSMAHNFTGKIPGDTNMLMTHFTNMGVSSTNLIKNANSEFFWNNPSTNNVQGGVVTTSQTSADFKTWLSNNNVLVYFALATPTYEIITDTELINQLEALLNAKTFDGLTNISLNSDGTLKIEYANEYEIQEEVDGDGIVLLNSSYKMFNDEFYLGGTTSQSFNLEILKDYVENYNLKNVIIKKGNKTQYTLQIDSIDDNSDSKYVYELTDAMVNFEFNYDASQIFVDNKTTLKAILQNICEIANVPLATETFDGQDMEISWYDNRITARQYIGMIAEVNGGFARINRLGELELVKFNNNISATVDLEECDEYKFGEYHKIVGVVFDNGLLVSKQGDLTGNVLYLNIDNVFINDDATVQMIYNSIKDFEFYSFKTKQCPIQEVLGGDIINVDDGTNNYHIIAQYELDFFGNWSGYYELNIASLKKEETRTLKEADNYKTLKIEQDRANAQLSILSEQTEEIITDVSDLNEHVNNDFYTKSQSEQLIINSASGLTNTFSEAGGNNILRNTNFSAKEVLEEGQQYEYWYGSVAKQTNTDSANGMSIKLQNGNLYQEQTVANGTYTVSFYYKKLNQSATGKVIINDIEYNLTETEFTLFQTGLKDEDGTYITQPIIVNNNRIKVQFTCDTNNAFEIYEIMCNLGSIKLAYSQNQNETVSNTVNIGKGISIEATDKDVKLSATPDGIRIKNKDTNDIITDFTDKGMDTKNAVIEETAEVVGIFRQRVGDQVWDSLV